MQKLAEGLISAKEAQARPCIRLASNSAREQHCEQEHDQLSRSGISIDVESHGCSVFYPELLLFGSFLLVSTVAGAAGASALESSSTHAILTISIFVNEYQIMFFFLLSSS